MTTTLKELKQTAQELGAKDLTHATDDELRALYKQGLIVIAYSVGIYGVSGRLFTDKKGGFYVMPCRNYSI